MIINLWCTNTTALVIFDCGKFSRHERRTLGDVSTKENKEAKKQILMIKCDYYEPHLNNFERG